MGSPSFTEKPGPNKFAYTFDHLAEIMNHFTEVLGLRRYCCSCQERPGLRRWRSTFRFDCCSQLKWFSVIQPRYERPSLRAPAVHPRRSQKELFRGRSGVEHSTIDRVSDDGYLEREIGVALFVRTTRTVTLTDAGLDFLARIEPVLAELEEAEHAARGTGELRGILRIGLPTNFAVREVIPRLPVFMDQHPALRIDLMTLVREPARRSEGCARFSCRRSLQWR
jgi:hypothetical protein